MIESSRRPNWRVPTAAHERPNGWSTQPGAQPWSPPSVQMHGGQMINRSGVQRQSPAGIRGETASGGVLVATSAPVAQQARINHGMTVAAHASPMPPGARSSRSIGPADSCNVLALVARIPPPYRRHPPTGAAAGRDVDRAAASLSSWAPTHVVAQTRRIRPMMLLELHPNHAKSQESHRNRLVAYASARRVRQRAWRPGPDEAGGHAGGRPGEAKRRTIESAAWSLDGGAVDGRGRLQRASGWCARASEQGTALPHADPRRGPDWAACSASVLRETRERVWLSEPRDHPAVAVSPPATDHGSPRPARRRSCRDLCHAVGRGPP